MSFIQVFWDSLEHLRQMKRCRQLQVHACYSNGGLRTDSCECGVKRRSLFVKERDQKWRQNLLSFDELKMNMVTTTISFTYSYLSEALKRQVPSLCVAVATEDHSLDRSLLMKSCSLSSLSYLGLLRCLTSQSWYDGSLDTVICYLRCCYFLAS